MEIEAIIKLLRSNDIDNIRVGYEILMAKYKSLKNINKILEPGIYMRVNGNSINIGYDGQHINSYEGNHTYFAPKWASFKLIN